MEPIVQAAIFTTCGGLIVTTVGGFIKMIVDKKSVMAMKDDLSKEHNDISSTILKSDAGLARDVLKGNTELAKDLKVATDKITSDIEKLLLKEKLEQANRFSSLPNEQKDVANAIDNIKYMFGEYNRLLDSKEVAMRQLTEKERELQEAKYKIQKLESDINALSKDNAELSVELRTSKEKCAQLQGQIEGLSQTSTPNLTSPSNGNERKSRDQMER